jgi:arginine:ornithine antiporter/lysine permease
MFIPATNADMPRFLRRENKAKTPIVALVLTSVLIQLFLLVTLTTDDALNFMLDFSTSLTLVPYFLVAAYGLKIAVTRDSYEVRDRARERHLIVGVVASVYTLFLIYTAGMKFLLLSCVVYAPGTFLYVKARRENGVRVFGRAEQLLCGALVAGAIAGVVGLASGGITI